MEAEVSPGRLVMCSGGSYTLSRKKKKNDVMKCNVM